MCSRRSLTGSTGACSRPRRTSAPFWRRSTTGRTAGTPPAARAAAWIPSWSISAGSSTCWAGRWPSWRHGSRGTVPGTTSTAAAARALICRSSSRRRESRGTVPGGTTIAAAARALTCRLQTEESCCVQARVARFRAAETPPFCSRLRKPAAVHRAATRTMTLGFLTTSRRRRCIARPWRPAEIMRISPKMCRLPACSPPRRRRPSGTWRPSAPCVGGEMIAKAAGPC
mmetsp:Transcript_29450/g.82975  ORF Transcript_29450/g.82975 Transcript_29450/m.82975 type:complete len:228 (-) Transcript_29450:211-894(-)